MQEKNKAVKFFSNPAVGIIGSIASLLGLLLAVIFYFSAEKSPELVYSVHPTKNVLVTENISSDITVFYKNKPITDTDIVAVNLSIWNNGNSSIRNSSILEPVLINLGSDVTILEATITKVSRTVTDLKITPQEASFERGIVPISWKILEGGDGGNIQIIYAGPKDTALKITGIIEEQGEPLELTAFSIETDKTSPFTEIKVMKWLIPSILIFAVVMTVLIFKLPLLAKYIPFLPFFVKNTDMTWFPLIVSCSPFILGAIYIFIKLDEWYPPFGF
jgi:hypothetical protein